MLKYSKSDKLKEEILKEILDKKLYKLLYDVVEIINSDIIQ